MMDYSGKDRISNLPDEILGQILSSLPTKVVASTSVLSKRWKNLLPLVDTLWFDDTPVVSYPNKEEATSAANSFLDFVDKTFALFSNSTLKKFSLCRQSRCYTADEQSRVNRWFWTAMERGIPEIHSHVYRSVELEIKLLTSTTLVKLTLSGSFFLEVERVFFPALKSLSLLSVHFDYDNYHRLIYGCPVLQELIIHEDNPWIRHCCGASVTSASIKRLVLLTNLPKYKEDHEIDILQAPSLVYLDYSSYVSQQYHSIDLHSLVEARLSLRLWESTDDYDYINEADYDSSDEDDYDYDSSDEDDSNDVHYCVVGEPKKNGIFGDVTNLIAAITNITTLHLSHDSLEAFHFCSDSMPVFNNLRNLSIDSNKDKGWQAMPLLLNSCPNLHTLIIKCLAHRVTNRCGDACPCIPKSPTEKKPKRKKRKIVKKEEELCCLWTCQVEVLEILEYGCSFQELKQMKHFLGKLECLDTVKVCVDADDNNELVRANLLTLPRLSSKCNIHFI